MFISATGYNFEMQVNPLSKQVPGQGGSCWGGSKAGLTLYNLTTTNNLHKASLADRHMSQNQPASPALGGQNNPSAAGLLPLLTCVSSAANNQKVQGLALFLTTQATEVRHITNWFEITQQDPAHVNLSNKGILLTQGACCT